MSEVLGRDRAARQTTARVDAVVTSHRCFLTCTFLTMTLFTVFAETTALKKPFHNYASNYVSKAEFPDVIMHLHFSIH